ncbi:PspC domain-containing protein [Pedobacter sp. JY14-1]|uniref:PspC domain-containing protein n=1 Tax=Pedobacter sp. JY14-1 TaxID=3034151 RepID=UPI0023E2884F|nr:PspC domain-containing protein [Pedobacter sp. JY14-1]
MKKTLNINIGNSIIYIEEDAYEMLTAYLSEVKQYFARNADNYEIVTDIENRIAEMCAEILETQQKQVIGIFDVQTIIRQMGSVSDFESSEAEALGDRPEGQQGTAYGHPYRTVRRLYRDTDQAMIAGVCAGLAHYLELDVRWVRLIALLTVFIAGSGILAYVILWIMIPRASTKTEKMTMRGVEANLKGFADSYLDPFMAESKGFLAGFFQVIGEFLNGTGRVIFKTAAVFIIVIASICLIGLFVMLFVLMGIWDADVANYFPFNIINEEYFNPLAISTFVVGAIPLLALILFSARVAFSSREVNKTLSFILLIIWLAGLAPLIVYITRISSEFKEGAEYAQTAELKNYPEYVLTVDRTRFFSREDSLSYSIDAEHYRGKRILADIDDEFKAPRNVSLWIEKSGNGKTLLVQNFRSRGKTFQAALKNVQAIRYDYQQTDSLVNFNPMVQLSKDSRWRGQEVTLTLKVPVGTMISLSWELQRYMSGNIYWDCENNPAHDGYTQLIMTEEGVRCLHERKPGNEE